MISFGQALLYWMDGQDTLIRDQEELRAGDNRRPLAVRRHWAVKAPPMKQPVLSRISDSGAIFLTSYFLSSYKETLSIHSMRQVTLRI